jgi:hypothetical protein
MKIGGPFFLGADELISCSPLNKLVSLCHANAIVQHLTFLLIVINDAIIVSLFFLSPIDLLKADILCHSHNFPLSTRQSPNLPLRNYLSPLNGLTLLSSYLCNLGPKRHTLLLSFNPPYTF